VLLSEEDSALISSWFGQPPDRQLAAGFVVLRQLCREHADLGKSYLDAFARERQ
jgi:hypothetical protein